MINPEQGFTSGVIREADRFVGRYEDIRDCIKAINTELGLVAVYGKRGVGKSSILRQIQHMALGDYGLSKKSGLEREIPTRPRTYLTVYYTCDSMIRSGQDLLQRLCNDQDPEDGLLRLVPNDGKEIVEFARTKEVSLGADLKVVNWGSKGIESSKYARIIPNDIVQTFRNMVNAIVIHQVEKRMKRDGLLVLLDEFDVIKDKAGLGSLIKSLSSEKVKFGVCGIGRDLTDLVNDHASIERLLEEGAIHVKPMAEMELERIITRAEELFKGALSFSSTVKARIAKLSQGYPYLVQLFGKECVAVANKTSVNEIDDHVFDMVIEDIQSGRAFPTLEAMYQKAIGGSTDRQKLLWLLAEHKEEAPLYQDESGRIQLKKVRTDADVFDIPYVDQLLPRLIDANYGPILYREKQGVYEFLNPVFRVYVTLRNI
ncbi:MAG TPA: AAA family ATPase [Elusimicrobiota bacterium]|nr:AAA family ATPase [Elusimicrobiota bacterium]